MSTNIYRSLPFHMYVAAFIVIWMTSFTIRYKVQGIDTVPTRYRLCRLYGYDTACLENADSCDVLTCGQFTPENYVIHKIKPRTGLMMGTKCGAGKICVRRKCVDANLMTPIYIGDETFHECKPAQPRTVVENRSEQCKRHGYDGACADYSQFCNVLHCARRVPKGHAIQKVIPFWGVDIGTKCGENKICVDRQCVDVVGEMPVMLGADNIFKCKMRRPLANAPVKTSHEQCKEYGFDVVCDVEHRSFHARCDRLICGYKTLPGFYISQPPSSNSLVKTDIYASTGTKCAEFHTCRYKKCVETAPEKMPVYIGDDIYHDCYQPENFYGVTCD